jgi:hypothetical protein
MELISAILAAILLLSLPIFILFDVVSAVKNKEMGGFRKGIHLIFGVIVIVPILIFIKHILEII